MKTDFSIGRRALLGATAAGMVTSFLRKGAYAHEDRIPTLARPNIIYIIADDLGVHDLGCYGQTKIHTPNIDALAASGMRFDAAYGGAPVCSPSRCALMTGKDMGHATIRDNFALQGGRVGWRGHEQVRRMGLRPHEKTVASYLRQGGYATALVGKWHLDGYDREAVPTSHGFDEFHGWLTQTEATQGYFPTRWYDGTTLHAIADNENGHQAVYETDICTAQACEYIRHSRDRPFFLTVAYNAPHSPHVTPTQARYAGMPWGEYEKNYAAMIGFLDDGVGNILETLTATGLRDDTIIFFSSDHGPRSEPTAEQTEVAEFFNSHGNLRGYKRDLYEGGLRVPLLVSWPGHIPAGSISSVPAYHPDFLPTALTLSGNAGPSLHDVNGIDLTPALLHQNPMPERFLYWETYEPSFWQAARKGRWKAVRPVKTSNIALYDLETDPSESQDIAHHHPDIVSGFQQYFMTGRVSSPEYI
ncbi:arylsulfatase [Komagataeibacter xylinus]|uniref:arylsulfatase n=1 Tax=Komagataeibacter xylinus TaxID=28448 RepID=UPI00102F32CA|nr:arylsulfatase [Komagataeibacter xylinus]